ncbi:MAG: tryptophan synthase subunit beta [Legionella sp.]|uniref:tryptophan synthase subunit beta n=1 Tax=Legionella sp. TaxID=459 RepID=UPI002841BECB|nr:tryptophan synthase subunit beta [Legionella sp.]
MTLITTLKKFPNEAGFFGEYGGRFVPPQLEEALKEVETAYALASQDPDFQNEYNSLLKNYVGRPSPLYLAKNLTAKFGGAKIYLKREDLNHTGAHKINHCIGEALLAKRMGKTKLLAETGAGQHGVALATAAALTGLECEIHMGSIDIAKQHPNVIRMKLLGATVVAVDSGGKSLKDAVDSAFGAFMADYKHTFFAIGSVVGPHPYPMMVRDFQSIVGLEAKAQIIEQENRLPDYLIACVGGGSNAMGLFHAFLDDDVKMVGVEPGGKSFKPGEHAATLTLGRPGSLHGMLTYVLQFADGQTMPVHSIASGLDYPGVGPQHSFFKDNGRVQYVTANDREALAAFLELSKTEGIIPALESSHALAQAFKLAPTLDKNKIIIVNLSGRGDKDIDYIAEKINLS